jgi:hypothetical protein
VPLWSDLDVMVDSSGAFRIFRPLHGLWVLTVIQGPKILHVEPIVFAQDWNSASLVVKMASEPLRALRVQ